MKDIFRCNAGGEKFRCILISPKEKQVIDILRNVHEQSFQDLRQIMLSKCKVIKRNAYDMRNFDNFRVIILHVMNSKTDTNQQRREPGEQILSGKINP